MATSTRADVQRAREALDRAYQNCPHWDYETMGDEHDCCLEVLEARRQWHLAKRGVTSTKQKG